MRLAVLVWGGKLMRVRSVGGICVLVCALVAAACVPASPVGDAPSGVQSVSVEVSGSLTWAAETETDSGFAATVDERGLLASVAGAVEVAGPGSERLRVTADATLYGDVLLGTLTVRNVDTGRQVGGPINGQPPVRVTVGADGAWDYTLVANWVSFEAGIESGQITLAVGHAAGDTDPTTTTTTTMPAGPLDPIDITTTALPDATVGVGYSTQLEASASGDEVSWSYTGELPAGLDLDPTGVITGIPAEPGSFSIAAQVNSPTGSGSTDLNLTVVEADGPVPAAFDSDDTAVVELGVEPGGSAATSFVLDQAGSFTLLACAEAAPLPAIEVTNGAGQMLGASLPSGDAGCVEVDPSLHPEHAWAANVPAGTYTATLTASAAQPAALRASSNASPASAVGQTNPLRQFVVAVTRSNPASPTTTPPTPPATPGDTATAVAAMERYGSCAFTDAKGVKCWGSVPGLGVYGLSPTDVPAASSFISITSGISHSCAVTSGGGVQCWGDNDYGQLGDGTQTSRGNPVDVVGLDEQVVQVSAGFLHTCAVTARGGVKCWGNNVWGEVGDGTSGGANLVPIDVAELDTGVVQVAAGYYYTCAVTAAGRVKCWGLNEFGKLGDGTNINRSAPVDVLGLSPGGVDVALGLTHACARNEVGAVQCWGGNTSGQLGDGSVLSSWTPVGVVGLSGGAVAIAASGNHTCALAAGGATKCWGDNGTGQLGDGTNVDRSTPVDVLELSSGVVDLDVGVRHSCAVTTAGGVRCWGLNELGQLGDGSTSRSATPVRVLGFGSGDGAGGVLTGEYQWCAPGGDGAVGTPQEYFEGRAEALRFATSNSFLEGENAALRALGPSRRADLERWYGDSPSPPAEALQRGAKSLATEAVGAVVGVNKPLTVAYALGVSTQEAVSGWRDAVDDINTSAALVGEFEFEAGVVEPLFAPPPSAGGFTEQWNGLAAYFLNRFVEEFARCPKHQPGSSDIQDDELDRWASVIYTDMLPGVPDVFGRPATPSWLTGAGFTRRLETELFNFFRLRAMLASDQGRAVRLGGGTGDVGVIPGHWQRFGPGVGGSSPRDIYVASPGAGTQITARQFLDYTAEGITAGGGGFSYRLADFYSLAENSRSVERNRWPGLLLERIDRGGLGFDRSVWESYGGGSTAMPSARDSRVIILTSSSFRAFSDFPNRTNVTAPYFYVVSLGTPLAEPDVDRQLNEPGYRYPVVCSTQGGCLPALPIR